MKSNPIYVVFWDQGEGKALTRGFTNRRLVADFLGIPYATMTNHFVREKRNYHRYDDKGVLVIKVNQIEKGLQRVGKKRGHNRNI